MNYIENTCLNTKNYSISKMCYFIYNIIDETYNQYEKNIQDIIPIENHNILSLDYILEIFKNLYKISMKKDYESQNEDNKIEDILQIYQELKEKYNTRVSLETIKKYIQSELNKMGLNDDNISYINQQLSNIIE